MAASTSLALREANAIVRSRDRYQRRHRSRRRAGVEIPIAVVAGFIPGMWGPINDLRAGNFYGFAWHTTRNFTGFNLDTKQFSFGALAGGWGPVLAGVLVHKLIGGKLGVNAALRRARVPFLRI